MSHLTPAAEKTLSKAQLIIALDYHRMLEHKIVFTNGCFDLLHVGHARYLAQAKSLGDILVVGLNSDCSVRSLKGSNRPLIPQNERAEMLAHLQSVDFICIFDEDRPDRLIEVVKPSIHVKGGDYQGEDLPEAEAVHKYGGKIVIVDLVEGKSTTNIIEKIIRTINSEHKS
jgi:rfaE bifunctional protein nucleotidyltransferase chain/domain